MQRINLFPNPVFAGPLTNTSHWGNANGTVRDNALHITGPNGGYGFNVAVPFNVPLVLSMRADASDDNVAGVMLVQTTDKVAVNNILSYQKIKAGDIRRLVQIHGHLPWVSIRGKSKRNP